jgi:hypothetical protein
MTVGDLVFANVVDDRVWAVDGERGAAGIYLLASPGRALPFTIYRAWKIGTGLVTEEVQFYGPSGRLVYRWGPEVRRMLGSMDLTVETDRIEAARFDETGAYLASFVVDGEIVGEVEVPVYVQTLAAKLPKEIEDGFKRSDVIWLGVEVTGSDRPLVVRLRNGKVLVLSSGSPPEEQSIPAAERHGLCRHAAQGQDTSLDRLHATVRLLEGAEWEEARRRSSTTMERVRPPSVAGGAAPATSPSSRRSSADTVGRSSRRRPRLSSAYGDATILPASGCDAAGSAASNATTSASSRRRRQGVDALVEDGEPVARGRKLFIVTRNESVGCSTPFTHAGDEAVAGCRRGVLSYANVRIWIASSSARTPGTAGAASQHVAVIVFVTRLLPNGWTVNTSPWSLRRPHRRRLTWSACRLGCRPGS